MPGPDLPKAASPAYINGWSSRIRCGMTPFLNYNTYYITKFNDLISNSR